MAGRKSLIERLVLVLIILCLGVLKTKAQSDTLSTQQFNLKLVEFTENRPLMSNEDSVRNFIDMIRASNSIDLYSLRNPNNQNSYVYDFLEYFMQKQQMIIDYLGGVGSTSVYFPDYKIYLGGTFGQLDCDQCYYRIIDK